MVNKKQEPRGLENQLNLLIILVLIVGFISTIGVFFLSQQQPQSFECNVPETISISGADYNKLVTLEYTGGFCERLGLESTVKVEDYNGIPYGVPICVAGEE